MKQLKIKSVLAVLVALCSLNVYAYDVEIDGIYYNLYPEYEMAEVTTGDAKYTGDIVIPESFEHDGITYTVKYIVNAFYRCGDITSIIIPNSITSIESMSFLYCTSLTSVTIPGSVTSIESSAFYGCTSLTSITIPNGVTSIGDRAFYDCSNLASVDISNTVTSIGRECFVGTPWYENLEDGVIYINDVLYKYKGTMPADTSITIKEGTVSISPEAFLFCDNLTSVIIPNSVRTIYDQAFGNSGLTEIYCYATPVPETDASAFNMVTTFFVTLHVPSASWDAYKEAFPWNAFNSIVPLSTKIEGIYYLFDSESMTATVSREKEKYAGDVVIPESVPYEGATYSVTGIAERAFYGCEELTSLVIPNSVTQIGEKAFAGCSNLTSLIFPEGITTIEEGVCAGTGLTSVVIPNTVTSIGSNAFEGCSALTSVIIPNSITSICSYAFWNCEKLSSVNMSVNVTEVGEYAFLDTPWCDSQEDGPIYVGKVLYKYNGSMPENSEIEIEEGTISISPLAFYECQNLNSIKIPNSVKAIGYYAFYKCGGLTDVYCYADDVPQAIYAIFDEEVMGKATLHVPSSSIDAYKTAESWKDFSNIVKLEEETNKYTLTYMLDGEIYKTYEVEYGATITPEVAPSKEGYTFDGWSEIPATMPANDVIIIGSFTYIDAIEDLKVADGNYQICTIDGKPVSTLQKGVNILHMKDGKTKKVLVK